MLKDGKKVLSFVALGFAFGSVWGCSAENSSSEESRRPTSNKRVFAYAKTDVVLFSREGDLNDTCTVSASSQNGVNFEIEELDLKGPNGGKVSAKIKDGSHPALSDCDFSKFSVTRGTLVFMDLSGNVIDVASYPSSRRNK